MSTTEASEPTEGSETTVLWYTTATSGGCEAGPTGNTCDYGDTLIPSPDCCDYYRQCSNNIEYEVQCQFDADGEVLWFDEEFQARFKILVKNNNEQSSNIILVLHLSRPRHMRPGDSGGTLNNPGTIHHCEQRNRRATRHKRD